MLGVQFTYEDGTSKTVGTFDNGKQEMLIQLTKETKLVHFYISNNDAINSYIEFTDIMIVKENSNTDDYVNHKEQTITFPLAEGQVLHKDDYLAEDGIHHKRKHAVVSISGIVTLSNGNVGGVCHLSNKIDKSDNMIISSNAVFKNSYNPPAGTVYENRLNIVFVGNQEDTLETLKEKYGGSIVEYELQDEEIEAYTEEQQQIYNKIQELHSYYGTTHITCEDETSCIFDIEYVQDHNLVRQNDKQELQKQIDEIKTLLSTSATSAMLLDNLQTDLESEV